MGVIQQPTSTRSTTLSDEIPSRPKSASLFDPSTKARANAIVGTIVAALVAAAWAKVEACQAKQDVGTAKTTAIVAKTVTDAAYEVTREKVDPQGEAIEKLRNDLNVLLAERETMRQKSINKGAVLVPEAVPPKPVESAAVAPLPEPAKLKADAGLGQQ